ncbi:transmembrane protein [Cystoisospora suis]|uniref:Transmembrane protein n=1 Tax=Cystoisospora suis TaxID=483139 RepID=A0A2C6L406_9APIC|nr:transmembrane protein [Cystoisospora suis]
MASQIPVCSARARVAEHAVPDPPSEIPANHDDPERARRIQENRKKNDKFWRDIFVETGVRRYRAPVEENIWKQRLTILAVFVIIIAGISQAVYRAYIDFHFGFKNIDVTDTERLKGSRCDASIISRVPRCLPRLQWMIQPVVFLFLSEVMFGGSPWIVLCRWPENQKWKLPELLDRHRQELMKFGSLGSIDCSASLPSGAKFSERFRIPSSTEAMVITNGKAPRFLNVWALKNWENLSSFLQRNTKVDVRTVEENISFTKHCLYPPGSRCLVFLRKGGFTPETKNKVIAGTLGKKGQTRKLKVVTVDTGKYQVNGLDIGPTAFYVTKVACIANISPPPTPEAKKKKDVSKDTFHHVLYEGELKDTRSLLAFAERCIGAKENSYGFQRMAKPPALRRRSSASDAPPKKAKRKSA